MSLHSFLTRLIWLCVLPLVLLAAYLAVHSVRTTQSERDLDAANRANNFATAIDRQLNARIGALRMLPRPNGHAAAPAAMETGKPAVGDSFLGPIAGEALDVLFARGAYAERAGKPPPERNIA